VSRDVGQERSYGVSVILVLDACLVTIDDVVRDRPYTARLLLFVLVLHKAVQPGPERGYSSDNINTGFHAAAVLDFHERVVQAWQDRLFVSIGGVRP
jgi:hypothetical protein